MCKPRHKREDDIMPVEFVAEEGLADFMEEAVHSPEDNWSFDA